ncbi:hypothetical protein [Eubacterium ventriosum]
MVSKERICSVCKRTYKYCPLCKEDAKKPTWLFAFCSENCKNIYNITSSFEDGCMTDTEAKAKLEKLDLSRKEYFGESYKNSIASIMKAKAQVIKKENKKTEAKSVKKDIVTKVEKEAKSNVE